MLIIMSRFINADDVLKDPNENYINIQIIMLI
jgi:hypothetical protein